MIRKEIHDTDGPVELRKASDRLYHRLGRFGYRLQHSQTVKPEDHHIQLKRSPIKRGFMITDTATGQVVCGEGFTATYQQIYQFWEDESIRRWNEKMAAKRRREKAKTDGRFLYE